MRNLNICVIVALSKCKHASETLLLQACRYVLLIHMLREDALCAKKKRVENLLRRADHD
jgi:hypothetical protein